MSPPVTRRALIASLVGVTVQACSARIRGQSRPVLIVCVGNSLTVGIGASPGHDYPTVLASLLPNARVLNRGVSAETTQDMRARATEIDALVEPGAWLLVWEITNDLYFNASADDAYDRYATYCQDRRLAGFRVAAFTVTPRTNFPGTSSLPGNRQAAFNERRDAVNERLRNHWQDFAAAFIDLGDDPRLAHPSDGVHYADEGYAVVAELAAASLPR